MEGLRRRGREKKTLRRWSESIKKAIVLLLLMGCIFFLLLILISYLNKGENAKVEEKKYYDENQARLIYKKTVNFLYGERRFAPSCSELSKAEESYKEAMENSADPSFHKRVEKALRLLRKDNDCFKDPKEEIFELGSVPNPDDIKLGSVPNPELITKNVSIKIESFSLGPIMNVDSFFYTTMIVKGKTNLFDGCSMVISLENKEDSAPANSTFTSVSNGEF